MKKRKCLKQHRQQNMLLVHFPAWRQLWRQVIGGEAKLGETSHTSLTRWVSTTLRMPQLGVESYPSLPPWVKLQYDFRYVGSEKKNLWNIEDIKPLLQKIKYKLKHWDYDETVAHSTAGWTACLLPACQSVHCWLYLHLWGYLSLLRPVCVTLALICVLL